MDIKLCQIYAKIHIYVILYRNSRFKQQIYNQSENEDITEKPNCNLGLIYYFIILFLFLIDIIYNSIHKFVFVD